MTHRFIYLIGQPGAGKSQLMARLTLPFERMAIGTDECPVAHDQLVRDLVGDGTIQIVGAEIGKRRDAFGGTDALPSSIIDRAIPWLATTPYPLMLAEGARLANRRFLAAALDDYDLTVAFLDHPDAEAWRKRRAKQIGRDQNPAWVKGRLSASRNLAEQVEHWQRHNPLGDRLTLLRGHPDELFETLRDVIGVI